MGDIDTTGNHSLPTTEIVAPLASTSQVQPSTQAELPATASEKQTAESQEQQPPSETHSVLPKSRAETPVTDVVIDLSSSAAKYQTTSTSENEETDDESKPHGDKKARRIRKRRKQKGKEREDEERGTTDEEGEIPDNLDSSENAGKGSWENNIHFEGSDYYVNEDEETLSAFSFPAQSVTSASVSLSNGASSSNTAGTYSSSSSSQMSSTQLVLLTIQREVLSWLLFVTKSVPQSIVVVFCVLTVQTIQLLSFVVDSDLGWGGKNATHVICNIVRFPRTVAVTTISFEAVAAIWGVFLGYLAFSLLLSISLYVRHKTTFHDEGKLVALSRLLSFLWGNVLILPFLHISFSLIGCIPASDKFNSGYAICGSNTSIAVGSVAAITSIVGWLWAFVVVVGQYDFLRGSKNFLSRYLSRSELLHLLAITLLSVVWRMFLFDFFDPKILKLTISIILGAHSIAQIALLFWSAPYYRWTTNFVKVSIYISLLFCATMGFIQAILPTDAGTACFIVLWVALVPVSIASYFSSIGIFKVIVSRLRTKLHSALFGAEKYNSSSRSSVPGSESGDSPISSLWGMTFSVIHILWDESTTAEAKDTFNDMFSDDANQIMLNSMDAMPRGAEIETLFSLFSLQSTNELQPVFVHLRRAIQLKPKLDIHFLVLRLDDYRRQLAQSIDGGAEEIDMGNREASKYASRAKELLQTFWKHLLRQNINELHSTVADLEKAEQKATGIYERLRVKYPKSSKVLRDYAQFLEDVRHDFDIAHNLYLTADAIEEQQAKEHRRKSNKKRRDSGRNKEKEKAPKRVGVSFFTTLDKPVADIRPLAEELHEANMDALDQQKGRRIQRLQWYKQQVAQLKSSAFIQLFVSIIAVFAVVMVNVTISYGLVRAGFKHLEATLISMKNASDARVFVPSTTLQTESLIAISSVSLAPGYRDSAQNQLMAASNNLSEISEALYMDAALNNFVSWTVWTKSYLNTSIYNPYTGTHFCQPASLYQLMKEISRRSGSIALNSRNYSSPIDYKGSSDGRYVLDNGESVAISALDDLVQKYQELVINSNDFATVTLYATLPATLLLLCICIIVLFSRSLYVLRREREQVLKLFLTIPRAVVLEIYQACGGSKADSGVADATDNITHVSFRFSLDLIIKFSIAMIIGLAFICGIAIFGMVSLQGWEIPVKFSKLRWSETAYLRRLNVISIALVNHDIYTYGDIDTMRALLWNNTQNYLTARQMADALSTSSIDLAVPTIYFLRTERNCSEIVSDIGYCVGLDEMDNIFLTKVLQYATSSESDFNLMNSNFRFIYDLETNGIYPWHSELNQLLLDHWINKISNTSRGLAIVFAIAWIIGVSFLLLLQQPLQAIGQQHSHTLKMFLLIPVDIIDSSTPEIREYLETGQHISKVKKIQRMLQESKNKTDRILQAAADAIIVFSSVTTKMEIFNAAAEKMFGYNSDAMIGKPLSIVLPFVDRDGDQAASFESVGKNMQGELFPVFVSKSSTAGTGEAVSAVFIRDVRDIREYQTLIQQNEALLTKMLPKSIAARLKNSLDSSKRVLIADGYANVSILFADIVKFSQWSTTIDAKKLVGILNELVSAWDTVALKNSVEKIKTIGDCYMAVTGCPEPSVDHAVQLVRFAETMLQILVQFNKRAGTDLHIRIGINSGPVVAGVIGLSKVRAPWYPNNYIKVIFDLWGPSGYHQLKIMYHISVNLASRMESSGIPDSIQVTEATYNLVKDAFPFTPRGEIEIKGGIKVNSFIFKPILLDTIDRSFDSTFDKLNRISSLRELLVDVSSQKRKQLKTTGPSQ